LHQSYYKYYSFLVRDFPCFAISKKETRPFAPKQNPNPQHKNDSVNQLCLLHEATEQSTRTRTPHDSRFNYTN